MGKKRSITDEEIALIKAMAARGMKGKDIQFFFNRPDRAVNSGRITGIKNGTYSDSAAIPAADDKSLDAFLASFEATEITASVKVLGTELSAPSENSPTSKAVLTEMFEKQGSDIWRFKHGESDKYECKQDFGFRYAGKWLRAVAALANNEGGYIVFGVKDKKITNGKVDPDSYIVSGLKSPEFANADPVEFSKRIKATFDPTPKVETAILNLEGASVGFMYVRQHGSRPVIAQKGDGEQVKEGDIFFRYPGQSARIKYSDLRTILDERDRLSREQILPMVKKLLQIGPRDAMVADLAGGVLSDENRSIVIGEDLLEKIKFIKEGQFNEKSGAATLKVVGDVAPINTFEIEKVVKENLLKEYPLTANEVDAKVRETLSHIKQHEVWKAIADNGLKGNKDYSAYNFRNKKQEEKFRETSQAPSSVPVIYKQATVDFLIKILSD